MSLSGPTPTAIHLRRRKISPTNRLTKSENEIDSRLEPLPNQEKAMEFKDSEALDESMSTYWLTALLILRCTAFVYFVAFCVAYFQNNALIGINGIYPYTAILDRYDYLHSNWDKFMRNPTLLWFLPRSDQSIQTIALIGITLSALVVVFGHRFCHIIIFFALWILYHSLANGMLSCLILIIHSHR